MCVHTHSEVWMERALGSMLDLPHDRYHMTGYGLVFIAARERETSHEFMKGWVTVGGDRDQLSKEKYNRSGKGEFPKGWSDEVPECRGQG